MRENRPKTREELCKRLADALADEMASSGAYLDMAAGVMGADESKTLQKIAEDEAKHRCTLQELLNVLCPCDTNAR